MGGRSARLCAVGCVLLAGRALGQDVAGVGAAPLEEMAMDGPRDLPGRVEGPRVREPEKPEEPTAEEEREWFGELPMWEWSRLTGDWGGGRAWLEKRGLTVEASFTWQWSSVWAGGLNQKASDRELWDVNATLDLDTAVGWEGGTFYMDAYFAEDSGGSRDVGDYQGVSNIDTGDDRSELAEVWYQQQFADDVVRLKVGKIDASYEFDFLECAGDFLHNSASYSPTLQDFPLYPDPAMGVVLFVYPAEMWYIGGGVFDGALHDGYLTGERGPKTFFSDSQSDSWFLIAETGFSWEGAGTMGDGRVAVGAHHHSGRYETFDGEEQNGSGGLYFLAEQQVWRWGEDDENKGKGLTLFGRVGLGDEDVNDVAMHLAGGCVLNGVCAGRPDDGAGAFVSYVDLSDAAGSPYVGNETAMEFYYLIQLTPAVSLTPDLQVIFDPSGDPNIDTAVVGAIRLLVAF